MCIRDSNGTVFAVHPASPDEAVFLTLAFAAAAAVLGVTCGSIFSLFYLALRYRFRGDGITARMYREAPPASGKRETMKKLVATTLPIAVGSIAMNVAGLIDATFLQNRIGHLMETAPQALLALSLIHLSGRISRAAGISRGVSADGFSQRPQAFCAGFGAVHPQLPCL